MPPFYRVFTLAILLALWTACGGGSGSTAGGSNGNGGVTGSTNSAPGDGNHIVQHVVIVVLENQDYADVVGSAFMPFLNAIARQGALATQFYANLHPSLSDYLIMTAGTDPSGAQNGWPGTWPGDNVVRQLAAAGKTWKVYADSLPSVGYTGGDTPGNYIRHHNPFVYFTDVLNSQSQLNNVVPFTQFNADLGANALPSYSFIVPNNAHNGHDCPTGSTCSLSDKLSTADAWLSNNFSTLFQNSTVMASTVVIITFDEANLDSTNGGGRVAMVFAGPLIKSGYQSTTFYQFQSLLRFSLESLGVTSFPNEAASAPSMNEFLK